MPPLFDSNMPPERYNNNGSGGGNHLQRGHHAGGPPGGVGHDRDYRDRRGVLDRLVVCGY